MRKIVITALAAITAAGAFAGPVAAEETSVAVSVADLDLSSAEDTQTLNARINSAVNTVCPRPDVRDLKANVAWEECKAEARSGALNQVAFARPFEGVELASAF
ncbi:UrcA family protein [Altererythrobacter atlanticus]|uniref:Uncharacterized protein n=2 Tax=Croceibacterium atlanticum TaxID=1267766 RepID=A0A0F7KU16_9SPHN|nr:UrcA family protein [Croceibacterium atlanticum]AKH43079.1 hypothetical protein WYH_02045 [Croceibacterium atlanticum]MBB5732217.1 UrcA family protein [Croceibacterium atlanticum]